jgi:hypothetical protein
MKKCSLIQIEQSWSSSTFSTGIYDYSLEDNCTNFDEYISRIESLIGQTGSVNGLELTVLAQDQEASLFFQFVPSQELNQQYLSLMYIKNTFYICNLVVYDI